MAAGWLPKTQNGICEPSSTRRNKYKHNECLVFSGYNERAGDQLQLVLDAVPPFLVGACHQSVQLACTYTALQTVGTYDQLCQSVKGKYHTFTKKHIIPSQLHRLPRRERKPERRMKGLKLEVLRFPSSCALLVGRAVGNYDVRHGSIGCIA